MSSNEAWLALYFDAPLLSFGGECKFDRRETLSFPSRSAVTGLVAAALGVARDDRPALARLAQLRLESVALEAEDIGETLASLCEDLSYDEREAEEVENRLDLIRSLKKKYGDSVEKILAYREKAGEEYDLLTHCDEEFAALTAKSEKNRAKIFALCQDITRIRKDAADGFCRRVEAELRTLNIANARFCAEFSPYAEQDAAKATADGLDCVAFQFSANAGEPLKPLSKVISGGEMSRLMLAIKTQADGGEVETYLFDEIDAGISGKTARTVAEKFAAIARRKQIVAVSHLAQIAAMADRNFLIRKLVEAGKTHTDIVKQDKEAKREELVRLLGGSDGAAAHTLADELIAAAEDYKRTLRGE